MKPRGRPGRKSLDRVSQKRDILTGHTSAARIEIFQYRPSSVPLHDLLRELKKVDQLAILAAIERLRAQGHELRPPLAEHLGDKIFYLRVQASDGNYRIFYWPFGRGVMILGHGFSKKSQKCPPDEIERARRCRDLYLANPEYHTYHEVEGTDGKDDH